MKLPLDKITNYKYNILSYGKNSITRKLLGNESHLNYPPYSDDMLCSF